MPVEKVDLTKPAAPAANPLAEYADVLDAVRGIGWPALHRVRSMAPGPHPSTARGASAEFIEYRPYRQGDDPRRIDWKLLARTDRVYTRLSQVQTTLPTLVVVDGSGSMAFPEETLGKWVFARRLAVALAAVARHRGDPVGLALAHPGGARMIPPQTRRTVLEEMMRTLAGSPGGDPPLAPVVEEALRLAGRVVVISDFLGDTEALVAAARTAAARRREVYAVHVVDPSEVAPDPTKLLVADPERPTLRRPLSPRARTEYIGRFAEWRAGIAREWRRAGAVYSLTLPGEEPFRRTVRRITHGGRTAGVR